MVSGDRARDAPWRTRVPLATLTAIYVGGFSGGLARYGITMARPNAQPSFPWATLAVNTAGALALAMLAGSLAGARSEHRYLRALLGTGFLGAFTTFASVMVSVQQLVAGGNAGTAGSYLAATVTAGFAAAWLGVRLGRALGGWRPPAAGQG